MKKEIYLRFVLGLMIVTVIVFTSILVKAQFLPLPAIAATANYCAANGKSTYYEYIDYVAFGAIARVSAAEPGGYADATSLSTNVTNGLKYPITLSHANPRGGYVENWEVFIDWNIDGDFIDAGEKALSAVTYTTGNYNDSILIPANAIPGVTRMRVIMSSNLYPLPAPCGTFKNGEVEDYSINILGSSVCSESYEPNNTVAKSKFIPVNVNVLSQISGAKDKDWYTFKNTATASNIKITLSTLPADYDVQLYDSAGTLLQTSANNATTDETIVYNTTVTGSWKIKVYGKPGVFNNIQCYTLQAAISATPGMVNKAKPTTTLSAANVETQNISNTTFTIYPNPAKNRVTLQFNAGSNQPVQISIYDISGHLVQQRKQTAHIGDNQILYDIHQLTKGIYTITIADNVKLIHEKLMVQ